MTPTAHMVDVAAKPFVDRIAEAEGTLRLQRETIRAIRARRIEKGDVLEVARVAAIQAAKLTPQVLPLCHPIPLEGVDVQFTLAADRVRVRTRVRAHYKTGVEMEALVAASTALLTIWDLVKPLEKNARGQYPKTRIEDVRVVRKVKQ